ncbi:flagellar protein FliJ [Colwellia sp. MT41]|uniref:Flagellar FliJ protein n=2 Tax=Colwelliaceae TaxID=267889 RepID=A0ABQ0MVB7_9GAMM|nr:flagellar export protein FliJ [Colwellia sp. MT2012]ALO34284.1 flagellar protein FliJ [Colwellia sp. MT41]GAW96298.1 flagellar export protein FliJ [Colwellia marinimaniae]
MAMKQLDTILKFEKDNEQRCADQLKLAENEYQQNITRLQGVADYRLEYMKRLSQRAEQGLDSATYRHYHAFIAKLDTAAKQVEIAMRQAKALVEQSKSIWLKQRQKVKAVELLRDKRLQKMAVAAQRAEQKMFDEIATQQFVRRALR